MAELSAEDVLREMDEMSRYQNADIEGKKLQRWLEVLRPALALRGSVWTEPPPRLHPVIERFGLTSNLRQQELRDMRVKVQFEVDHEGGGTIEIDYNEVPEQHRLQGLIQLMAAIGIRIELAVGRESFINMLRGRADRLERGL